MNYGLGQFCNFCDLLFRILNVCAGQFPCPAADMKLKVGLNITILYWLPRKAFGRNLSLAPAQGWNAVIETNLTGTYLMSREGLLEQCRPSLHIVFLQHTSSTCLNMEA